MRFSHFKDYILLVKGQLDFLPFLQKIRNFCWKLVGDKIFDEVEKFRDSLAQTSSDIEVRNALEQIWEIINLHMQTVNSLLFDLTIFYLFLCSCSIFWCVDQMVNRIIKRVAICRCMPLLATFSG